jgi:hypothetical protein
MKSIKVSNETYDRIKDQLHEEGTTKILEELDALIGSKFFFQTVTFHWIGRVVRRVKDTNIFELESASWVAYSGRFMNCIKDGELDEVEPVGTFYLNLDTVTSFLPWKHTLDQKQR